MTEDVPPPNCATAALPDDRAYHELLDAVENPILLHRGGPIIFVNRALTKLTGWQTSDLVGAPYYNIVHPEFRELARQRGDARLRGEAVPKVYELRLSCPDENREIWVELTASRVRMSGRDTIVASFHDLTERRLATAQDRELRRVMAQIIDGDPVPTFVIDANHRVTHWNRACAAITGTPAADIIGTMRQWAPFYTDERPVMADLIVDGAMEQRLETHYRGTFRRSALIDGAFEAETFFPHFGERGCWLYFTAAPLRDSHGRIIGAIETLQDVTAKHEAEEALRRHQAQLELLVEQRTSQLAQANDQLIQSEKLASIGQLAAGVAHEINNPIGYVHSNIGALENYIDDLFALLTQYETAEPSIASPEQADAVKAKRTEVDIDFLREDIPMLMRESREGITRVKKIVQDLKDFSHVDANLEWAWADLHAGIDSTLSVVTNEIKYKADVVREYGEIPEIECLASQLNQVFMNLLVNAAHAMGEQRGTITVRTGSTSDSVWLEFADTGSGMPESVMSKIFDPFFTTKPIGKGTGLGLSLSYGIIQKHNGNITVRSKPGEGTTFRIVLPIKHVEPECETSI